MDFYCDYGFSSVLKIFVLGMRCCWLRKPNNRILMELTSVRVIKEIQTVLC